MDTTRRELKDCVREFMDSHGLKAMRVSYVQNFNLSEHSDYWAVRVSWIDVFKEIVSALVTLETPGLTKLYAKSLSRPDENSGIRELTYKIDHSNAPEGKEIPPTLTDKISNEFWSDLLPKPEEDIYFIQNILEKLKNIYEPSHDDFTATIQDHGLISKQYGVRFIIAGLPSIDPYSSSGYFGRSYWMTAIESAWDTNLLAERAALEWLYHPRTSYKQDDLPFFIKNPDDLYRSCSTLLSGKFAPDTEDHPATDGKGNISEYWAEHHTELDESLSGISQVLERLLGSKVFAEALLNFTPVQKVCCAKSFRGGRGFWLPFVTEILKPRNFRGLPNANDLLWRIRTNKPGYSLLNLKLLQDVLQREHTSSKLRPLCF